MLRKMYDARRFCHFMLSGAALIAVLYTLYKQVHAPASASGIGIGSCFHIQRQERLEQHRPASELLSNVYCG
jgi:hypothetical protein